MRPADAWTREKPNALAKDCFPLSPTLPRSRCSRRWPAARDAWSRAAAADKVRRKRSGAAVPVDPVDAQGLRATISELRISPDRPAA